MIEQMSNLPDNALGFVATGTVTAHDYRTIVIPAVEDIFSRHQRVRLLYQTDAGFTGFEATAAWEDIVLAYKHYGGWEKVALVSDVEWIRIATKMFGFALPGQVNVFHNSELNTAVQWISE
ncbi:hypothetical protein TI04_07275 [Achromatium sp. WMS2]|nr:hypothetical protein TI04_07275 [Achromatium sp. WMS2]